MALLVRKKKKLRGQCKHSPHQLRKRGQLRPRHRVSPSPRKHKEEKPMGIRRVTSSSPCLILVTRVERSLLKRASGASKFISVLDGMGMKLQSKP
eukprot:881746-Pelagomonas_calceolata.AAC.1